MRDRRVVYDSEDEDGGFSAPNSPASHRSPDVDETATPPHGSGAIKEPTSDSLSTDPDFFKQVYEAQLQRDATAEAIPNTAGEGPCGASASASASGSGSGSGSGPRLDQHEASTFKAKDNSSSITEPTLKSEKGRAMGKTDAKGFAQENLTQVTTPSAPRAKQQKDIYDFSLSGEEGEPAGPGLARSNPKAKKAAPAVGKRKRGQAADLGDNAIASPSPPRLSTRTRGSSLRHAIQIEDAESPRSARKRRKSTQRQNQRQMPDHDAVDLLIVPTTADMDDPPDDLTASQKQEYLRVGGYLELDRDKNHDHDPEGVVPGILNLPPPSRELPPASFFIAPPDHLTASQKQEYLPVSGSSELDRDGDENHKQPSLPTPKIPQVQGQQPPNTDSTVPYTTPSRYCPSAPLLPVLSSPNLPTPSNGPPQMDVAQPHSSPDELNLPAPEPRSRNARRKRDEPDHCGPAQDDSWGSDKIGFHRDTYVSRTSRRRPGADLENGGMSTQPEASMGSVRSKRRKKEEQHTATQNDSWDSDKIGFHREMYVPRPSRRRSRAVVLEEGNEEEEEIEGPGPSMPDTLPPRDATIDSSGDHLLQENTEGVEGLDREFLEAMPEDIRQELISDHITRQHSRNSQAPRTRGRGPPGGVSSAAQPVPKETSQPKKRGRKKKEQKDQANPATVEDTEGEPVPAPAAMAKKKRGRPKKAESAQPPPPAAEADEMASRTEPREPSPSAHEGPSATRTLGVQPVDDVGEAPRAPSKRGRKKKVVGEPGEHQSVPGAAEIPHDASAALYGASEHHMDVSGEHADAKQEREALRDISNTASQNDTTTNKSREVSASEDFEKQKAITPEPKAKEIPRSGSSTGRQSKVPLRVGLSKKSRITPLLKMIRK